MERSSSPLLLRAALGFFIGLPTLELTLDASLDTGRERGKELCVAPIVEDAVPGLRIDCLLRIGMYDAEPGRSEVIFGTKAK